MPVFSVDFYTIFSILYHFDTVLGGFMGLWGGGWVGAQTEPDLCISVFTMMLVNIIPVSS